MYSDLRLVSTWPVARHVIVCRGLLRAEFGHQPGPPQEQRDVYERIHAAPRHKRMHTTSAEELAQRQHAIIKCNLLPVTC